MASERESGAGEGPDPLVRGPLTWPTPLEIGRQLGLVVAVGVVWGAAFAGMLRLTSSGSGPVVEGPISAARAERMAAREGESPAAPGADSGEVGVGAPMVEAASPEGPPPQTAREGSAPPAAAEPPRQAVASPPAAAPVPAEETARPVTAAAPAPPPVAPRVEEAVPEPEPVAIPIPGEEEMEEPGAGEVGDVSFARDVMPILEGRCISCHGGPRREGGQRIEEGLSLLSHREVMAGSTWGPVVLPGDPAGSYLLELILSGEMPDDAPRLLPREIRVITQWILAGAPDN
jgi:hypothetical protein